MKCGICGLPIHEAEAGIRSFGWFSAHSERRCVELLKAEIARLKRERDSSRQEHLRTQSVLSEYQDLIDYGSPF